MRGLTPDQVASLYARSPLDQASQLAQIGHMMEGTTRALKPIPIPGFPGWMWDLVQGRAFRIPGLPDYKNLIHLGEGLLLDPKTGKTSQAEGYPEPAPKTITKEVQEGDQVFYETRDQVSGELLWRTPKGPAEIDEGRAPRVELREYGPNGEKTPGFEHYWKVDIESNQWTYLGPKGPRTAPGPPGEVSSSTKWVEQQLQKAADREVALSGKVDWAVDPVTGGLSWVPKSDKFTEELKQLWWDSYNRNRSYYESLGQISTEQVGRLQPAPEIPKPTPSPGPTSNRWLENLRDMLFSPQGTPAPQPTPAPQSTAQNADIPRWPKDSAKARDGQVYRLGDGTLAQWSAERGALKRLPNDYLKRSFNPYDYIYAPPLGQ